jgi:hypothetical protein
MVLGSARVPACRFRRLAGKTVFGETPNTTRETRVLPGTIFAIQTLFW